MSIKPPLHPTTPPDHRLFDEGRDHRELLLGGLRGSHFASADGGFYGDPFWHGPLEPLGCTEKHSKAMKRRWWMMEMGKTLEELWKSCYRCLEFVWEYYSLDISWLSWYIDHGSFRKPSNSPSERKLLQAIAWLSQLYIWVEELKEWWEKMKGNCRKCMEKYRKKGFWASKMVEDADFSKHAKELGFSHCRKWTFTHGYWNWVCLKMVKTELKMRFGLHDVPGWNVAKLMEIGYPLIRNVRGHLKLTEQAQNEASAEKQRHSCRTPFFNNIGLSTLMVNHQNSSWKPWLP